MYGKFKKQLSIVFLTTFWGSNNGGINHFNYSLCTGIGMLDECQVFCFVLNANSDQIREAQEKLVGLISLDIDDRDYFKKNDYRLVHDLINEKCIPAIDYWVGHDIISGNMALDLKKRSSKGKAVVIHHMDYESYETFKLPSANELNDKIEYQQKILEKSDVVFAVGPSLYKSAKRQRSKDDIVEILPGLEKIESKFIPDDFSVITYGRIGKNTGIIKQTSLVVKAFSQSINIIKNHLNSSILTIIGVDKEENNNHFVKEASNYADRIVTVNPLPYTNDRKRLLDKVSRQTVCVIPSLYEGFSLAGMEAISAEVPLIISKRSGLYLYLERIDSENMVWGMDVTGKEKKDISCLQDIFIKLSTTNKKTLKDKAKKLRCKLEKEGVSWEETAKKFLENLPCIGEDLSCIDKDLNEYIGKENTLLTRIDYTKIKGHVVPVYRDLGSQNDWFRELEDCLSKQIPVLDSRMLYYGPTLAQNWIHESNDFKANRDMYDAFKSCCYEIFDAVSGGDINLVDLGVGDFTKGYKILKRLLSRDGNRVINYFPFDISSEMLDYALTPNGEKYYILEEIRKKGKIVALNASFSKLYKYEHLFEKSFKNIFILLGNTLGNEQNEVNTLNFLAKVMQENDFLIIELQLAEDKMKNDSELTKRAQRSKEFYSAPFTFLGCLPEDIKIVVKTEDHSGIVRHNIACNFKKKVEISHYRFSENIILRKNTNIPVYIVKKYTQDAIKSIFSEAKLEIVSQKSSAASKDGRKFTYLLVRRSSK